jgi:hypothetical protein
VATLGAFFDANVLYPSGLRNFLMHLALTGIFHAPIGLPKSTTNGCAKLLKNRPDITREELERTRRLMDQATPDALVTGHESLIESIELPDRDDRHVLAAAIRCGASLIVTLNLSDFPIHVLRNFSIEAQHPDDFVIALLDPFPNLVLDAARIHRASLKNPPKTQDDYLAELDAQGLSKSVSAIRDLALGGNSGFQKKSATQGHLLLV